MTLLLMLALVSTALLTYAVAHALRHDPRPRDLAAPRSHRSEVAPRAWYDTAA